MEDSLGTAVTPEECAIKHLRSSWHVPSLAGPRRWSRKPSWTTTSWRTWSCLRSMRWWTACTLWIMGRTPASSRRGPLARWSTWWKVSESLVICFAFQEFSSWGFSWVVLLKLFFWICFDNLFFAIFTVDLVLQSSLEFEGQNTETFVQIVLAVRRQLLLSSGDWCEAELLEKPLEIVLQLSTLWHFQQQHKLPEARLDLWQLLPSVVQRVRTPWACWMLTSSVLHRASVSLLQERMGSDSAREIAAIFTNFKEISSSTSWPKSKVC